MPRALELFVLAGCSGSMPTPDAGLKVAGAPDAGPMDAGTDAGLDAGYDAGVDAGTTDAGPPGACIVNMPCDAGENLGPALCFLIDPGDGGREPYCETV